MLALTVPVTLAIVIMASVLIEHERETRYKELEERADRTALLISHSMAYPVWNVDLAAVDEQLDALASDPKVVQCIITAIGYGTLSERGELQGNLENPIIRVQDIFFSTSETGTQKIGEVRIVMTREFVEETLSTTLCVFWVLIVVILSVIYITTYLLLRRVVKIPVNRLEVMVDQIARGDMDARCSLNTKDELGKLAGRVNMMADRLQESSQKLRESEKRLQLVLDGSQLGYWDWNIQTGEVIRNSRWAEMLGYTLEEVEFSVNQWTDLHHPEDRNLAWKAITDHLEGRTTEYEVEYRMRTRDGNYRWILDQAKIVSFDAQGKPLRMCGTHRDITERKQAELEKERLQNQLSQSRKMEAIGQLAGGMAHDFNNILSVILNASQLLMIPSNKLNENCLKYVDMIHQSSIRASDLIGKLLAFSRKGEAVNTVLDLHQILSDVTDILKGTIDKKINISLVDNASHHNFAGDFSSIENALLNLGINASHAMPDGGKLEFRTCNTVLEKDFCDFSSFDVTAGEYIRIDVEDSGSGIPEENLDKIFEPFFTTKKTGQGTGLGLSAVYGTIREHQGMITVESEIGSGTTFSIFLPCVNKMANKTNESKSVESGSGTILLVDDEKLNRMVNKDILESLGYEVLLAENGLEAINVFKDKKSEIDIVLMDMIMPEMDGSEAFHEMNHIDESCKVIIASGYTNDQNIDDLLRAGLAGFIQKPYTVSEISKLLTQIQNRK
ncbi:MAG: PAS domain-containing protein [Spirochaetales bacterium]|nr:PAS domain-containing protein [Spirochaetales bacterium]